MDKFACFNYTTKEVEFNQSVIVNGVPVKNKRNIDIVTCSNCNNSLVEFQGTIPVKQRGDILANQLNGLKFCPHCGAKLVYNLDVIDAEIKPIE